MRSISTTVIYTENVKPNNVVNLMYITWLKTCYNKTTQEEWMDYYFCVTGAAVAVDQLVC